jgi:hypothetical protein
VLPTIRKRLTAATKRGKPVLKGAS